MVFYLLDPEFQKMDMLLALTNSITAFNRWEKDTKTYRFNTTLFSL